MLNFKGVHTQRQLHVFCMYFFVLAVCSPLKLALKCSSVGPSSCNCHTTLFEPFDTFAETFWCDS